MRSRKLGEEEERRRMRRRIGRWKNERGKVEVEGGEEGRRRR